MDRILVVAGNKKEYEDYIRSECNHRTENGETTVSLFDYTYVYSDMNVRGLKNPTGVFIGTWRERSDIDVIFYMLLSSFDLDHPSVNKLKNLYATLPNPSTV